MRYIREKEYEGQSLWEERIECLSKPLLLISDFVEYLERIGTPLSVPPPPFSCLFVSVLLMCSIVSTIPLHSLQLFDSLQSPYTRIRSLPQCNNQRIGVVENLDASPNERYRVCDRWIRVDSLRYWVLMWTILNINLPLRRASKAALSLTNHFSRSVAVSRI